MADQSLQNTVRLFSLIDSSCQIQLTNVCLFSDSLFRLLKRFSTISRISLSTNQSDLLGGCLFAQGLLSYKLFLSVGDARNIFPLLFPCPCFHPFLSFILSLYPHTYTHTHTPYAFSHSCSCCACFGQGRFFISSPPFPPFSEYSFPLSPYIPSRQNYVITISLPPCIKKAFSRSKVVFFPCLSSSIST